LTDKEERDNMLEFGSGSSVTFENLDEPENNLYVNGKTEYSETIPPDNATGVTEKASEEPNSGWLRVGDNVAKAFYYALEGGLDQNETAQAVNVFSVLAVFHEGVRYGRFKTGLGNDASNPDQGDEFEKAINITDDNTKRIKVLDVDNEEF